MSSKWLAIGSQRFPVQVRLPALHRGELSAAITWLMPKRLWSGSKG